VAEKESRMSSVINRARETLAEELRLVDSLASLAEDVPELCKEITMALYVRGIVDEPRVRRSCEGRSG